MRVFAVIILLFIITGCSGYSDTGNGTLPEQSSQPYFKTYHANGKLEQKVPVVNGFFHGTAEKYYENGALHSTIEFIRGEKEGKSIWYYESGEKYRVTNYVKDKKHGYRQVYYESGKLMAEVPFENDKAIPGLMEYTEYGDTIKQPDIVSEKSILNNGKIEYVFKLTDGSKNADFFYYSGPAEQGSYIEIKKTDGEAKLLFENANSVPRPLLIRAEKVTRLRNRLVLQEIIQ